jgi:hypothetical protein
LHEKPRLLSKVIDLLEATLHKADGLSKPCLKFVSNLFITWLSISGRYNFQSLSRYGNYCDKSLRNHFDRSGFDFTNFNCQLISFACGKERIAAFDPSFLNKSGRKTHAVDWFYDGGQHRQRMGLEIGCLAVVDVPGQTAFPLSITQTPNHSSNRENDGLMKHYSSCITSMMDHLKELSVGYIAVDGYFMKKDFINTMLGEGLEVVTKMRHDANLMYLFTGKEKSGPGRKRLYDKKVDCKNIDRRRIKFFHEDDDSIYYSGIVYSISLKRKIRIVYIEQKGSDRYAIIMSTDVTLKPSKIILYYRLRFQIEFLIRDAKSHSGLEHCQARSEKKMNFHYNMSFSAVALSKAALLANTKNKDDFSFSMKDIKTLFNNKLMTDAIFSILGMDLNCPKIRKLYKECLNFGARAA